MRHAHRSVAGVVAALIAMGAQASAQRSSGPPPQRGGQPKAETPYILVTAFHAPTKLLAVEAADELRSRLSSEHSAQELFVITKSAVEATLRASGYPVDSALSVADLMELGRALRAEYVIDGTAKKGAGSAVRFELRVLIRTGQQVLTQPLPGVDGKDVGDAAKQGERAITEAIKQMPAYRDCIAALRAGKYDDAAAKARLSLAAYSNSLFARICLLNAYSSAKASPDSIIGVANQIVAIDSTSMLALANLADAYDQKGDKPKAAEIYQRMLAIDPNNESIRKRVVGDLSGQDPEKALKLIEASLRESPGDVELTRNKWLILLRMHDYKKAMDAGEELVKLNPESANQDYFQRQIGAAQSDSNSAKIIEFAVKASGKFPKDVSFPLLVAQTYRKQGQLPPALVAARKAADIDPKDSRGWLLAIFTAKEMNQPDTALAIAKAAAAAGTDRQQLESALLQILAPVVKKAQDSKERADWEAALASAQTVNGAVPSPASNFYVGLASFQVGLDALQNAQKLGAEKGKDAKESKAKACAEARVAEDMWANATIAMTSGGGGTYNKEGATSVMAAIQQYGVYIPDMKKAYCGAKS